MGIAGGVNVGSAVITSIYISPQIYSIKHSQNTVIGDVFHSFPTYGFTLIREKRKQQYKSESLTL